MRGARSATGRRRIQADYQRCHALTRIVDCQTLAPRGRSGTVGTVVGAAVQGERRRAAARAEPRSLVSGKQSGTVSERTVSHGKERSTARVPRPARGCFSGVRHAKNHVWDGAYPRAVLCGYLLEQTSSLIVVPRPDAEMCYLCLRQLVLRLSPGSEEVSG